MIPGHATMAASRRLTGRYEGVVYHHLKGADLFVSAAGFGGYRVHAGSAEQAQSLEAALTSGINLIDTSATYTDGESERLVGEVLASLIADERISREQVVVVTKGGYLQGENYALSQKRKSDNHPFPDLVEYTDGLEHCIHPDFLCDQIERSRTRLGLDTIDGYLLHNPEYYLSWAKAAGVDIKTARGEYARRIEMAFRCLERAVAKGRIRFYGVSSNTFPVPAETADFTSLSLCLEIAESIQTNHHFRMVQMPFNLFEAGAVLEKNQPDGKTVLNLAREKAIAVLINRPFNAFWKNRLVRLADVEVRQRLEYREIISRIKALAQSETRLWRRLLPALSDIPGGIKVRIKQQGCVAEALKHHWRSFGSLERWVQTRDGVFMPRIQGVVNYLAAHAKDAPELAEWLVDHRKILDRAFRAVASNYADAAIAREQAINRALAHADTTWAAPDTLSQRAIGALMSTAGVSSVLVGMRRKKYVRDVLGAMAGDPVVAEREDAWARLNHALDRLN